MASEYLLQKYKDVKPDEPPPPLTGWPKFANWFHYNKIFIAAIAVVVAVVASMVINALGIGQIKPDYHFAFIGDRQLPVEQAEALSSALAALGEDGNGDGRVHVELRQYALNHGGDQDTAMYYDYAESMILMADLTAAESYFFLMEDPADVQRSYQILAREDGTPPADDDYDVWDKVYRWGDCPALAGLDVDQSVFSDLYIGRRCFYVENQAQGQEKNDALWQVITKGATR